MRYKDSIKTSLFILFAFISGAIIFEILQSGKANPQMWQSLLPKKGTEVFSFFVALFIFLNTLNWSLVYLISRFNEKIWQRIDYPFLILSIALAVSVAIRLFSSGIPTKRILLTAVAGIFAVYNVYRYWSYFKKRKQDKNQGFNWGDK